MLKGGSVRTGGTEYTKNLIVAVNEYARSENLPLEILLVVGAEGCPAGIAQAIENLSNISAIPHPPIARRYNTPIKQIRSLLLGSDNTPLTKMFAKEKIDFVYPYHVHSDRSKFQSASWIPDFQHKFLPEYFTDVELKERDTQFDSICRKVKRVVVSSESVKADLNRFYTTAKAEPHVLRSRVSHPAGLLDQPPQATIAKYHLPKRFFLVSNQFWAHKNHSRLLEAAAIARQQCPDLMLVMTGKLADYRNEAFVDSFIQSIHTSGLIDHIRLLGLVPKIDQLQLMRGCSSVVQPSLCEGWSTVVEETRCLGKPILISNLDVHREQNPPKALFADPYSVDDLAAKLIQQWQSNQQGWNQVDENEAMEAYRSQILAYGKNFYELAGLK